jgi:hypothetical protein
MRQKQKACLETTILSFATGRVSGNLITAAKQQFTQMWLDGFPKQYDCFVSELVISEAMQGDPDAAVRRHQRLLEFAVLSIDLEAQSLAAELVRRHSIPVQARTDALHVAIATVNEMDYLVTWNCTHINNAAMRPRIEQCCSLLGYHCPIICTPMELEVAHD